MRKNYLWYEIKIEQDEFPESPREWDNLWTLVTAHRNYNGDDELPEGQASIDRAFEMHLEWEWLTSDEVYYHEVWLYEHSWVAISTSPFGDRWDSWQWGYIYVSIEKAKEELILKDEDTLESKTLEYLDNEIKTLDKYYRWEIYEYKIELLWEMSWWYESIEEALTEAKAYIDVSDPEWKINKLWDKIYNQCMDDFWNRFNEEKFESDLMTDEDWIEIQANEDLLTEIVWDKLRNY